MASTWSKLSRAQRRRRLAQVALVHAEREPVLGGVAPGELGVGGLELEAVQVETRHPGGEAERGGAGAAAELEHALAGARRDEGGEQHRVGGGAVAAAGLPEPDAAVEEGVAGELRRRRSSFGAHETSGDVVVAQDGAGAEEIAVGDHQPARQEADRAFEHAHVDVQNEAVYILAPQQRGAEGDDGRVIGAQEFPHGTQPRDRNRRGREPSARTPFEELQAALAGDMDAVNALIRARMASEHAPRIPEVTAHLVEAGGKRLRPLLTLAAARLCGYEGEHHLRLAATVEFIHTATLLHDDVVDESQRRRGRPTANLLWDNKSSVLVGDYLFARAFQLMVETGTLRVLDILANASAVIAEGEVLQLTAASDLATDEATYLQVVRGKTAALFAAAAEVGGVIAGGAGGARCAALARLRRRARDRLPDRRRRARLRRGGARRSARTSATTSASAR